MGNVIKNQPEIQEVYPTMQNERVQWMDIAKGIGILFVVFAHVNYTPSLLVYIYSFHMPLFFVLSGMLFRREKYRSFAQFAKRKFFTLICPYLFFYMISMFILLTMDVITDGFTVELIKKYLGYFLQMFIAEKSATVISAPLWFIPCLLAVEIIYFGISKFKKPIVLLLSSILSCVGWAIESKHIVIKGVPIPWSLDSALFAMGFFAIGNILYDRVKYVISKVDKSKFRVGISIVGGVGVCPASHSYILYKW